MNGSYLEAVKNRRSYYALSNQISLSQQQLEGILEEALLHSPYAFNSQSGRIVLLTGTHHQKLWEITKQELEKVTDPAQFPKTQEKVDNSFLAGYGTVLFFEDQSIVEGLQESFPLYQANFPLWSLQASGMLQHVVWTALEACGLGANLQHYNELIETRVQEQWEIPNTWKMISQMPFGKPTAPAGEKAFEPIEKRLKIYRD